MQKLLLNTIQKLSFKDYALLFFAVAFIVSFFINLTKGEDTGARLLHEQEIKLQQLQIEQLQIERDSLEKQAQTAWNDAIQAQRRIDTLEAKISNIKPIIKYIKKDLNNEINKTIVVPNDNILDSAFTSILRNK